MHYNLDDCSCLIGKIVEVEVVAVVVVVVYGYDVIDDGGERLIDAALKEWARSNCIQILTGLH